MNLSKYKWYRKWKGGKWFRLIRKRPSPIGWPKTLEGPWTQSEEYLLSNTFHFRIEDIPLGKIEIEDYDGKKIKREEVLKNLL